MHVTHGTGSGRTGEKSSIMRNGCCSDSCQQSSPIMKPVAIDDATIRRSFNDHPLDVPPEPNPLPRRELFLIWLIHASQGFQTTMLFPMLVFMVESYGATGVDGRAIGWHAGLLASLFPLAQCCTSMMWGLISDRTGRKPWLAFGCFVSAVSALLLGFCTTYKTACLLRFVGGLLNGTLTVTKSALAELCDGTNQAKGFGILNLAWGIGSIAGPVLSGLLAQPCVQYNMEHCPHILEEHPFLLPCVGAAVFSIAGIMASFALKETNPRFLKASYNRISPQLPPEDHLTENEDEIPNSCEMVHFSSKDGDVSSASCRQKLVVVISTDDQSESKRIVVKGQRDVCRIRESENGLAHEEEEEDCKRRFAWVDRNVLLASLCYSMTGLIFIITDELFPMFGAASRSVGGLGFTSSSLGMILGEGGVVLCLYTLLLYPKVCRRLGPLKCFRLGILSTIPLWIFFPMSSLLFSAPVLQWTLLLLCMAARSVSACTTFTGVLILVSNSAAPGNMGAVTGLSHSFCSFFRAIGPACGGLIWSFASGKTFFLHQFLAWQFVVVLSSFTYGLSFLLPMSLSKPKLEVLGLDKRESQ